MVYLSVCLLKGETTPQSPSVSESASVSEYRVDRKVLIDFCVSSYMYQFMPVLFTDIHPHLNNTKLYPFCIQIWTSEGSSNGYNFLIMV